jgi:hypothetical protein
MKSQVDFNSSIERTNFLNYVASIIPQHFTCYGTYFTREQIAKNISYKEYKRYEGPDESQIYVHHEKVIEISFPIPQHTFTPWFFNTFRRFCEQLKEEFNFYNGSVPELCINPESEKLKNKDFLNTGSNFRICLYFDFRKAKSKAEKKADKAPDIDETQIKMQL